MDSIDRTSPSRSSQSTTKLADAMDELSVSLEQLTESMGKAADGFDAMAEENTKLGATNRPSTTTSSPVHGTTGSPGFAPADD